MSGRVISVAILVLSLFLTLDVLSIEEQSKSPPYKQGEIIVKFRQGAAETLERQLSGEGTAGTLNISVSLDELSRRHGVKSIKPLVKGFKARRQQTIELLNKGEASLTKREKHLLRRLKRAPRGAKVPELDRIYKIELEEGQSAEEAVAEYNQNPDVEYAELNYTVSIDLTPNDPYYNVQWALNNTGQYYPLCCGASAAGTVDVDIDAPEAWDIYTGSSDIIVAVIDTGVDYTHADLVDNMWTDGSGNFGIDYVNGDNDPMDDHGHGTHCAGIIASIGNNGTDTTGVCWDAKIMGVKFLNDSGSGLIDDGVSAIYYAVNHGADVLSNSWGGGDYSTAMEEAINYAYSQGVIVVAAAGNNGSSSAHYPAYYEHVIAVASINSINDKAGTSNYGDWVDIAAPGVYILSLRAENTDMYLGTDGYDPGDRFVPFGDPDATMYVASGTSMACPHVSGACALLASMYPGLTVDEITDIIFYETDPIASGICRSNGRLNLYKSLTPSMGRIYLDRGRYSCSDEVSITLIDFDLQDQNNVDIVAYTDACDIETVFLNEGGSPFIFANTLPTESGEPNIQDGVLQVLNDQTIYFMYGDANNGFGEAETVVESVVADCCGPAIFNVQVQDVTSISAVATFQTNEDANSSLSYGPDCNDTDRLDDSTLRTEHSFDIIGLEPLTTYYFKVQARDELGNIAGDNNDGSCYQFTTSPAPGHIYVPTDYPTIQEAIDAASDGHIIIVQDATYTGDLNRDIRFNGKMITLKSANGPENCIIDCQGTSSEHHRGVKFINWENQSSVLDGFTIKNGYTTGKGGGIYCVRSSPTIRNCIIENNKSGDIQDYWSGGGGIYCHNSNARFINCVVRNNYTRNYGGGIWCYDRGKVQLLNCVFAGNKADYVNSMGTWSYGGGISCFEADAEIKNCLIDNNWAHDICGGITFNRSPSSTISNCTIAHNQASELVGGVYQYLSNVTIEDSIIWGNIIPNGVQLRGEFTISYSDIQGGWPGTRNIDMDPCFATGPEGYYYLSQIAAGQAVDSPCVDAGGDWAADAGMDIFATRTDEVSDVGMADMGYHYPAAVIAKSADIDENQHVDFFDFAILAADWLECSDPCDSSCTSGVLDGDIVVDDYVDTYDIAFFADCWLDCLVNSATTPTPAEDSLDADTNIILSWNAGNCALEHDVYLGTDANAVADADYFSEEYMGRVSDTNFGPCQIERDTIYYWRVDEVGSKCTTKGDIWSFKTWFEPNFISWWKFDEGSGSTAGDSSGNGNDGAIIGATWFDDPNRGMCLNFDGSGDDITVNNSISMESMDGSTAEYTISLWVKTTQSGAARWNQKAIFERRLTRSSSGQNEDWTAHIYLNEYDGVGFLIRGGGQSLALDDTLAVNDDEWHHIAAVRKGTKFVKVYVDGNLRQSSATNAYCYTTHVTTIGVRRTNEDLKTGYFDGKIDDVRIYGGALTEEAVGQLYEGGL